MTYSKSKDHNTLNKTFDPQTLADELSEYRKNKLNLFLLQHG